PPSLATKESRRPYPLPPNRHDDPPLASRPVEFAEENVVPGGHSHWPPPDREGLRGPHQGALDVSGRIVVDAIMKPIVMLDDHLAHRLDEICADVLVVVFVDGDRCRRMRREHRTEPVTHAGLAHD